MKNIFYLSLLLLLTFYIGGCQQKEHAHEEGKHEHEESMESHPDKLLRHVVIFKFKEEASPEDIQKVEAAFVGLKSKISEIYDLEWGINNSPEGLNKGFTHCFFVSFASEEDRAAYLPHPDHKAFVDILSPSLEDVMVVDYWTDVN